MPIYLFNQSKIHTQVLFRMYRQELSLLRQMEKWMFTKTNAQFTGLCQSCIKVQKALILRIGRQQQNSTQTLIRSFKAMSYGDWRVPCQHASIQIHSQREWKIEEYFHHQTKIPNTVLTTRGNLLSRSQNTISFS